MKSWRVAAATSAVDARRIPSIPSDPGAARIRLASSWIQPVTSLSAGPPLGGLYLNPPSSGGLCDGVTTMPSARWRQLSRGRLATTIACEMAGVGVNPSDASTRTSTPFATRTSSAVRVAGSDRACGIAPDEQRAAVAAARPVAADRLGDGQDVRLVEGAAQRRATVSGRPEGDALGGIGRVGPEVAIRVEQRAEVDQGRRVGRLTGAGMRRHVAMMARATFQACGWNAPARNDSPVPVLPRTRWLGTFVRPKGRTDGDMDDRTYADASNANGTAALDPMTADHDEPTADASADAAPASSGIASLRPAFLSELAGAMHAAAARERERIAAAMSDDAVTHVEKTRARAEIETQELRRLAGDDVSRIEDWSASETKRIKAEATQRIAERRANLDDYLRQHDAIIAAEVEAVEAAVTDYGATLDAFFAGLTDSNDPSEIVRIAERLPTPPDLDAVRATARGDAVGRYADSTDDTDTDGDRRHRRGRLDRDGERRSGRQRVRAGRDGRRRAGRRRRRPRRRGRHPGRRGVGRGVHDRGAARGYRRRQRGHHRCRHGRLGRWMGPSP